MSFTAKDVQSLREKTGCGMMDCKKALSASDGDMDKAVEFLREKGLAAVDKKAGRVAAEGIVSAVVDHEKKVGAIVEVNSETDFVAKNQEFVKFVDLCAKTVMEQNPADVTALLAMKPAGEERTVEELLRDKILVIGENLKIRRFARYEGVVECYIHGGGRIGVLVKFAADDAVAAKPGFVEYAKDIAMQIAAVNPGYLDETQVPAEIVAKEREILMAQIENDEKLKNKPAQVIEKMLEGKIKKFYEENCLVDQAFVKEPKLTVLKHTEAVAKELGGAVKILDFTRFEKGEGIEKKEDNFADEVASMIK